VANSNKDTVERRGTLSIHHPASVQIVREVAKLEGEEVTELPPLYDEVDLDTLTSLVVAENTSLSLKFEYADYRIKIKNRVFYLESKSA